MKVGDLVKISRNDNYWWSNKVGIIDRINEPGSFRVYRVHVPCKGYARFRDPDFVEVISETR